MCGRGFDPRFIFAWPSARTAVMGGAQAAKVMDIVNRGKLARSGPRRKRGGLAGHVRRVAHRARPRIDGALYGTARLWDDGIIDPRDTRRVLALCLAVARDAEARVLRPNTFGVARM